MKHTVDQFGVPAELEDSLMGSLLYLISDCPYFVGAAFYLFFIFRSNLLEAKLIFKAFESVEGRKEFYEQLLGSCIELRVKGLGVHEKEFSYRLYKLYKLHQKMISLWERFSCLFLAKMLLNKKSIHAKWIGSKLAIITLVRGCFSFNPWGSRPYNLTLFEAFCKIGDFEEEET